MHRTAVMCLPLLWDLLHLTSAAVITPGCSTPFCPNTCYSTGCLSSPSCSGQGGGSSYGTTNSLGGTVISTGSSSASPSYGSSSSGSSCSCNYGFNTGYSSNSGFQNINVVPRFLSDYARLKQLYLTFNTAGGAGLQEIDNTCYTLAQLPDNPNAYLLYRSVVYVNGSNQVITYVTENTAPGIYRQADSTSLLINYDLGTFSCNIISYTASLCGGQCNQFTTGISPEYGQTINPSNFGGVQQLVQSKGLPLSNSGSVYFLPMNLPPRCVYQTTCPSVSNIPFAQYMYPSYSGGACSALYG